MEKIKQRFLFLAVWAISKVRMMIIHIYRFVYYSCRAALYLRAAAGVERVRVRGNLGQCDQELIVVRVDSWGEKRQILLAK